MPSGLILTHWSPLAIAIISSCFLFYFVASENARHTTQNLIESDATFKPSYADEKKETANFENSVQLETSRDPLKVVQNTGKQEVLRNYKKVKKAKSIGTTETSSSKSPFATSFFIHNKKRTDVSDVHEQTTSFLSASFKREASSMSIDADKAKIPESADQSNHNINENLRGFSDNIDNAGDNSVVFNIMQEDLNRGNGDARNFAIKSESNENEDSLPNIITDIPAVTVTELPLEVLQPMQGSLNAILVDASKKKSEEQDAENRTMEIVEENIKEVPPDDQIVKINDSGGDNTSAEVPSRESLPVKIASENESTPTDASAELQQRQQQVQLENITADSSSGSDPTLNLTSEEVPMPVFSEWAQKQMEAAEKQQQAKEQEVVNTIAQKKNLTNGSKKLPTLKMRAKNYASPDCGAKIIASTSDASNTGAVLSSSKDEYMLSPCGNRIWFVVELCEAIQAQKVDLANFELFSSSPKNFTVAVANRFPTRDWSNVGRFVAEDKRNVQSFDLHPHLFGKFVRVDIHSHYSQEHFCPVSLFRVFGTSEIEAFETENHFHDDDLDDFDVEFDSGGVAVDQQANKKNSENIFKSASDAVMSIVKKAAEVLVKPSSNQNQTLNAQKPIMMVANSLCRTSKNGLFSCEECTPVLVERVNDVISCRFRQLDNLLAVQGLRKDLLNTQICHKRFGVEVKGLSNDCANFKNSFLSVADVKRSYFINLLPEEYIGALCHTLSSTIINASNGLDSRLAANEDNEMALNLTIEKKLQTNDDFKTLHTKDATKRILKPREETKESSIKENIEIPITSENNQHGKETPTFTTEGTQVDVEQLAPPLNIETITDKPVAAIPQPLDEPSPSQPVIAPDINIFNVPDIEGTHNVETEKNAPVESDSSFGKGSGDDSAENLAVELPLLTSTTEAPSKNEEDVAVNPTWENLDTLLPSTMAPGQAAQNFQQKLPGSPQSESVFIRLSNRIKALERNMSLSGQYLEELSRRYKKQVEELQQTLTQQTQNVRNLEEQNRRHLEMQRIFEQNTVLLRNELDNMALQMHACIIVIIVVGAFVLLLIVISTLFYRTIWHRSKALQKPDTSPARKENNKGTVAVCNRKKLPRRKSFDDLSDHGQEKLRRPSEEAMDILKKHLNVTENHKYRVDKMIQTQPQRKMSVCYSGAQIELAALPMTAKNANVKRKTAKNSWSNPNDTRQIDLEQLEELRGMDLTLAEYKQIMETEKLEKSKTKSTNVNQMTNGQGKSKKKTQNLRRRESAPGQCDNVADHRKVVNQIDEYGENLLLDEDLDNFIPTNDLAYNEFMPEGPSGYQTVTDDDCRDQQLITNSSSKLLLNDLKDHEKSTKNKKQRRIPSTGFFKSPFSKALKIKSSSTAADADSSCQSNTPQLSTTAAGGLSGSNSTPHSKATSWEWHRLRNSVSSPCASDLFRRHSPTGSLDASTLSEIHFPTNSTNNSYRILEEAILSSGEAIDRSPKILASSNGNQSHSATSSISGGSASNSSQRSSISNTHSTTSSAASASKKKQRGFNRIFRKVF